MDLGQFKINIAVLARDRVAGITASQLQGMLKGLASLVKTLLAIIDFAKIFKG